MLWVNGERVETEAAHISALDRGFTIADGLFETMLARRRRIFRAARHLERLHEGARILRIMLPDETAGWLGEAVQSAMKEELDDAAAVRLTVSRGVGAPGLALDAGSTPTVVIAVNRLPAFPVRLYEHGLSALTATGRRNERAITAGVKSLAYTEAIVALAQAHDAGADEAILLDTEGHISEASASNVFLCKDGALVTPPISCGALPGITRAAVLELAPALGLTVEERPVVPRELTAADEVFLTSSLRGIAPLVRVDQRAVGRGTVGPVTRSVMRSYEGLVERECTP
jgi:branched-chain amino acid aminotransferase